MEIIDNFGLPSRVGNAGNPWLENVLRKTIRFSKNSSLVRLKGERQDNGFLFQLQNNQNKTYAALHRLNQVVRLELKRRRVPDPELGFRPGLDEEGIHELPLTQEGIEQVAQLLAQHLEQETPYSRGEVTRVKVTPTNEPVLPWTFCGGRICQINEVPGHDEHRDKVVITVEGGKCYYVFTTEQLQGHRPIVKKYILKNEKGEFQFISSQEFDLYLEMLYEY